MARKNLIIGFATAFIIIGLFLFAQEQSTVKLACSADGDPYLFTVDIKSSTVNGHSADIEKDTIEWLEQPIGSAGDSISYYINRYTGQLVIGKKFNPQTDKVGMYGRNKVGMCQKVTDKWFFWP
ncbi:MAG: hypothetical protein ABSH17_01395, partial [Syntrophobacteraceae bacterium]